MRPIPVAFHIWFLEVHTYGIGLALTFWFALRYAERRLRGHGYPWQWVTGMFLWIIVSAIIGARALHVLSNLSFYSAHPAQVIAIWQGGLSSFGGLLFAVPVGIVSARRRCPDVRIMRLLDLIAPVLMAAWCVGRLLGPQLMRAGGGHPTTAWFGMYYADQVGKRLPVPIFQAMEDFIIFAVLILVERRLRNTAPRSLALVGGKAPSERVLPPAGIILGVGMTLWGIERFLDEHLWLGEDGHLGSLLVQLAGIALAVAGLILLATRYGPLQQWRSGALVGDDGGGLDGTLASTGRGAAGGDMTSASADDEADAETGAPGLMATVAGDAGTPGEGGTSVGRNRASVEHTEADPSD